MFRFILFPFAVLYDLVTNVRNVLYERGYQPSTSFDIPVISVGNLAVGGTGKTPMIEYLIRLLTPPYHIATLSRGYGRNTRGFRIASENETSSTLGDEPLQLFKKFGSKVTVSVAEERVLGISQLVDEHPDIDVILLDDAFQHRRVRPLFQILLTDFNRPFYADYLLPMGRLRESRRGVDRADIVIVTRSPLDLREDQMMKIEDEVRNYTMKPVFFSTVRYGTPLGFEGTTVPIAGKVILLTGIADAQHIETYVKQHFTMIKHFEFSDHHAYDTAELKKICTFARSAQASVITTEKDAVKLDSPVFRATLAGTPFFYLPIQTEFLKNGKEFDEMVLNVLGTSGHS